MGRGAITTPAACIPACRESPSSRSAIRTTLAIDSSEAMASFSPGESRNARSKFTSGPSGTSFAMRSPSATGKRQDPRDVPYGELGLQLRERHDLGHVLPSVLLRDVVDDLAAPRLAEVDVDVGHRDPLRVEESLEEQVVAEGIDVRDAQGPGDDRARGAPASRAHGDALLPGVADEVRDDQEVRREPHLLDDAHLVFEPLPVLLRRDAIRLGHLCDVLREAAVEAGAREVRGSSRRAAARPGP